MPSTSTRSRSTAAESSPCSRSRAIRGRGVAVSELAEPVGIDIAYGGSCTGGKREDLVRYHAVLKWAVDRGLSLAPGVRFYLQFGSQDVREYCLREVMFEVFERAGIDVIEPGCGACVNAGPGVSERADQVTVSAINRNFPGRSGPGKVWLASPSTVAASAIAGRIVSFDELRALAEGGRWIRSGTVKREDRDEDGSHPSRRLPLPRREETVLDAVKWEMLEEWSRTKRAPKHVAFARALATSRVRSTSCWARFEELPRRPCRHG
jgi:aconitase A